MHSDNVVDATDTKTLAEESNLCLWVLTQLDTFVHGWNDVWLGQELVRNEMVLVHCNFECGASGGYCGDRGQFLHVVNFPFKRCCTLVVHAAKDLHFLWVFVPLQLS